MDNIDLIVQKIKDGVLDANEVIDKIEKPWQHISEVQFRAKAKALPTGLDSLDAFSPLRERRGELVVLGARPGMGKSALMFQVAAHVATTHNVLVFSLEMDPEDVLDRLFSQIVRRPVYKFPFIPREEHVKAKGSLDKLKLKIYQGPRPDTTTIANVVAAAHKESPLALIVVDYLGLIKLPGQGNRHEELGNVTKELVAVAKKTNCPILVATQLNRQVDSRGRGKTPGDSSYKPIMSDIKDSGDVEADADVIMFLSRQSVYDGSRPGEADLEVFKNRAGKTGNVVLRFNGELTQFVDPEGDSI